MADKEATLKLTLKSDGFKAGLSDAEKAAAKAGANMGKGLSKGLTDAGKAGLDALKGSLMSLKNAAMTIGGIGGGLGLVDMANRAVQSASQFRKLSFQIRAGTGEMKNWRDMQRDAQATALKFGHTTEEVGKSIADLYAAVGDPKFAQDASKIVAEFATGAHEPLETMTNLAGGLNEKFGVTAQQLPEVLASVISLGNKGGVSVQDMADKIGIIGANAKVAGLDGAKGFATMISWLNIADNSTGNLKKGIAGVSGIIDSFATGALNKPLKALGIDVPAMQKAGADFNTIIGKVFEKTGGKTGALSKIFSGDQLKVIAEMGETYARTFEATKGDVKTQTAAGLAAFNDALKEAGESQVKAADITAEAAAQMQTPEMKIKTALEKLAQMFTSDKMMSAFESLAKFLPQVIETMMNNPILTGAFLTGVPQAIIGSLGKSLSDGIGSLFKGNAFTAGAGGAALPIAAIAGGAFLGGKELIDRQVAENERRQAQSVAAGFTAGDYSVNSKTMKFKNPEEAMKLAQESGTFADSLDARVRYARMQNNVTTDSDLYAMYDALKEDAKKALPGGNEDDWREWVTATKRTASADAPNVDLLRRSAEQTRNASAAFAYAGGGYQQSATWGATRAQASDRDNYIGMQPTGDAQYGLGLGGPIITNRQKRQEAEAAKEEARVQAQKQDYAGLIDGITAPLKSPLAVRIIESVPLETKGGGPGKGSTPVE